MLVTESDRLRLRHLTLDDAAFILELLNDAEWLRFIGDKRVRSLDDAKAYITNGPLNMYRKYGFGLFLTERRDANVPIGLCGLIKRDGLNDVDIGFAFLEAHRGQGFAYEAARAVLQFAAGTLQLERIVAITTVDNERSGRLLERLGLEFERMVVLPNSNAELRLYGNTFTARAPLLA